MSEMATKQDWNGTKVFKAGQFRGVVVLRWFGYKTDKSRKQTWNETLLCSGPVDWVQGQWDTRYSK